ncbi:MAG: DUF6318 family protein, partial [Mycobacteriaceae bacterium]
MPAEAKGTSAAAAKAFVRHYLAVFSYAARTGDTDAMSAMSDPACKVCDMLTNQIKRVYAAGGRVTGRGYAANKLAIVKPHTSKRAIVHATVILFPQTSS